SEELFLLRTHCLEERLEDVRALANLFADADQAIVTKAVSATRSLEGLDGCAAAKGSQVLIRQPQDPPIQSRGDEPRARLARAKMLGRASKWAQSRDLAKEALADAHETGYLPIFAEALYAYGSALEWSGGDLKEVESILQKAASSAGASQHDEVA